MTAARIVVTLVLSTLASAAPAERVTVAAGQSLTVTFDIAAARKPPWPLYTGVSLVTGLDRSASSPDAQGSWQVFAGPDGSGRLLLSRGLDRESWDFFGAPFLYGRFSARLTVTQGSVSVDPMASAFRNYGREIGVEFGEPVPPVAVKASP